MYAAAGCSLDAILMGGMRETTITELAGESCSGKTQVRHVQHCLCISCWRWYSRQCCGSVNIELFSCDAGSAPQSYVSESQLSSFV